MAATVEPVNKFDSGKKKRSVCHDHTSFTQFGALRAWQIAILQAWSMWCLMRSYMTVMTQPFKFAPSNSSAKFQEPEMGERERRSWSLSYA